MNPDTNVTASSLALGQPTRPESAPASIQFSRLREIEVPWLDLLEPATARNLRDFQSVAVELQSLKYFEQHWRRLGLLGQPLESQAGKTAFDGSKGTLWDIGPRCIDDSAPKPNIFFIILPAGPVVRTYVALKADGSPVANTDFAPVNAGIYDQLTRIGSFLAACR